MNLFYEAGGGQVFRGFKAPGVGFLPYAISWATIIFSVRLLRTMQDTPAARGFSRFSIWPRNVYVFGLTSFLNDTASEMAYWVLPAFLASLGAGPAQLGIIEGIAESVASFAKLFSGYLTDKVSQRKPIVVGGYFVANAVKPLLALVSSWWQILGIRFFDRFAKGVRGTARDVMVAESVEKSGLGSAYGLIQAMDSAGAIAGPLLALAVIGRFGMRGVFASAAIPGALCVIVAWVGIREGRRRMERPASSPVQTELRSAATVQHSTLTGEDARRSIRSEWLPKLPFGFYYVLAVVTLFSLGNSSDMFLVLRAGSIGIAGIARAAAGAGLQHHVHFILLAGRQFQRPLFALDNRRGGIFCFRHRLFCFRAGAIAIGDLAGHGVLRALLCADECGAEGAGRGECGGRCPGTGVGNVIRFSPA